MNRAKLGGIALIVAFAIGGVSACKKKVSQPQCDEMIDRFAELVVKEQHPDAGAAEIAKERDRERNEAKADQAFKNCTSEVQTNEHACAMKASTSEALIKCLE
ncbi:MAG TPA: hypothetical protein VIF62_16530 [Labilithrix sp.]